MVDPRWWMVSAPFFFYWKRRHCDITAIVKDYECVSQLLDFITWTPYNLIICGFMATFRGIWILLINWKNWRHNDVKVLHCVNAGFIVIEGWWGRRSPPLDNRKPKKKTTTTTTTTKPVWLSLNLGYQVWEQCFSLEQSGREGVLPLFALAWNHSPVVGVQ